ncbi:transketolase [Phycicoccus flavus]|uniref:transketolase n=1 Tax=Phycicoccus flavus TaxID=2502783 RepID=UPI000FEB7D58|nr:transketolase [Phycicoccus flavus]NHA68258.1 transketolase [Phycicoccus flavus]
MLTSRTPTTRTRDTAVAACREAAHRIRMGVLVQGEAQGEGYVAQGLGAADILAVAYTHLLRLRPQDPDWPDRDRFLLSTGHYALLLYSALAEAGTIPVEELRTYAADGSRLPMSAMSTYTPGVEISGGSLGHGLGLAVGTALGQRLQARPSRTVVLFSDGELDEGSTWEAAMAASSHRTGDLLAFVDMNGMQADGPTREVLDVDDQVARWESFGWRATRVDGNDVGALVDVVGLAASRMTPVGVPQIVLCDTRLGAGVPMLESREKLHFMKIAEDEWPRCMRQLTEQHEGGRR